LVELILSQPPDIDRHFLAQFLRRDTGIKKCAFRLVTPEQNAPMTATQLVEAIKKAAAGPTGGLIVEAIDAPEVRDALREAESKGLPVVVLDSPGPSSTSGRTIPYVTFKGFADSGKRLLQAAIDDVKLLHLPADGPICLLQNREEDRYSRQRLESLTSALKAAGTKCEVIAFDGQQKGAFEASTSYIKSHPKLAMILADDDFGVAGAFQAYLELRKSSKRKLIVGGFAACDARLDPLVKEGATVLVDRNVEGYAREALQLALGRMDGIPTPDRAEVGLPFVHNAPELAPDADEKALVPRGAPSPPPAKLAQPPASPGEPKKKPQAVNPG
jgi:ABC-type sugar transport system substrate-binding protein